MQGGITIPVTDEALAVRLMLTAPVAAGTLLRLRTDEQLWPLVLGVYEVESVLAVPHGRPLPIVGSLSYEAVKGDWYGVLRTCGLCTLSADRELPAGTVLDVAARKYRELDRMRSRFAGREALVWAAAVSAPEALESVPVTEPVPVRVVAGPAARMEAWLKPDRRLQIQHFDAYDNAADVAGERVEITAGPARREAPLRAGPSLTETQVALAPGEERVGVRDSQGRECVSTPLPLGLDGTPLYFGEVHTHSGFSDGAYATDIAVERARREMGLDFAGPADHVDHAGRFGSNGAAEYAGMGRSAEEPGRFCRIPAFELGSAAGHDVLCAESFEVFVPMLLRMQAVLGDTVNGPTAAYYEAVARLCPEGRACLMPAHPIGHAARWPRMQPAPQVVRNTEMFRGPGSQEADEAEPDWHRADDQAVGGGSVRTALERGYRLGFTGCSDAHPCLPGQPMTRFHGLTGIQAPRLDTATLFRALYHRRCYATSGARIVADATCNGLPIGSELEGVEAGSPLRLRVRIRGTAPIAAVQVVRGGCAPRDLDVAGAGWDFNAEWSEAAPAGPGARYLYLRARQADGHCVWLSPFWF